MKRLVASGCAQEQGDRHETCQQIRAPNVTYILISFFLYFFSMFTTMPLVPQVILALYKGDTASASTYNGFISAMRALATLIVLPILGYLSDRFGRKPILLASMVGLALEYLVVAESGNLVVIGIAVFISGTSSAFIVVSYAYVVDVSPPDLRSRNFGFLTASLGAAVALGPFSSGIVAQATSLRVPFWIGIGLVGLNAIYVWVIMPESKQRQGYIPFQWEKLNPLYPFYVLWAHKYSFCLGVAYFISLVPQEGLLTSYVLYFKYQFGWGPLDLGFSLSFLGLCIAVSGAVALPLSLKYAGERHLVLLALLMDAFSITLYALVPKGEYLYIVFFFRSVGFWVGPLVQGMISKEFPMDKQPDLLGVLTGLKVLNDFIGPLIFGSLFAYSISDSFPGHKNPGLIFFVACAIFLVSCLFAAITFWIYPPTTSSPSSVYGQLVVGDEDEENADNSKDEEKQEEEEEEEEVERIEREEREFEMKDITLIREKDAFANSNAKTKEM